MKSPSTLIALLCFFAQLLIGPYGNASPPELLGIDVTVHPQSDGSVEVTVDEQALARTTKNAGERIIERSSDLKSWIELARLPAGGASNQWVDEHPPADRAFYRVRVDEPTEYASNEVLVQFRSDADSEGLDALYTAAGLISASEMIETQAMTDAGSDALTRFSTTLDPSISATILRASPYVVQAAPDIAASLMAVANDPAVSSGQLWAMSDEPFGSGAAGAWAKGKTGSPSVVVAVIDTGVGPHPDLLANMFSNPLEIPDNNIDDDGNGYVDDVCGWDFSNNDNDASDDAGHGTHVAGTIGGVGNNGVGVAGVCWNVKILPLKVLNGNGRGSSGAIIRAIDYVTDLRRRGINIVAMNLSLGSGPVNPQYFDAYSASTHDALVRAADAGVMAVCAAGNDGDNNDLLPVIPASIDTSRQAYSGNKSSWDNVISVAAMDRGGLLSSYSNFGLSGVDLAGPGGDNGDRNKILSTIPVSMGSYAEFMGTSMAAPHVAGALALYASSWNTDGPGMRWTLLHSTLPTASQQGRTVTGGRLNVSQLLSMAPGQSNRSPMCKDDLVPLSARRPVEISPLANDTDPDGNAITISSFTAPRAGVVERKAGNPSVLIYTPSTNFNGSDSFGYTVADTAGATSLGSIKIQDPARVNLPPVANDDHVVVEEGESLNLRALMWNDRDPNGDKIRFHCAGFDCGWGPPHGFIMDGDYTPLLGFIGTDAFGYAITDGTFVARGIVTVEVVPTGGAPRGRATPTQPSDRASKVRRAPLFRWQGARGAAAYDLEICLERPGRSCRGYTGISAREFRIPASDALPANTKCFWRVRPVGANGAPGNWSGYRSFTSRSAAPPDKRPRLIWPPTAASSIPVTPTISWESVEEADNYQIQIAKGLPETTSILPGYSVEVADPSWEVPAELALENGQLYFWRVLAKNEDGDGFWTEWQPFSCGQPVPAAKPVLRSPANGSTGASSLPTFDWDDVATAGSWRLQIRRVGNGSIVADVGGIAGSQYTLPAGSALSPGESFDWRVQAANSAGTGVWSDRWTFRTRVDSPVSLQSPAHESFGLAPSVTLSWSGVTGADGYDYEVYDGSTLVAGYGINYSGGPYRATSVNLSFDYGKTYRWRARARILPQDNPWTPMWTFVIKDAPQSTLLSPANGAAGLNRTVTLDWTSHPEADGYDFEVKDGGTVVAGYGINYTGGPYRATSVTLTLNYGRTYTWKARPRILPQNNPWSASWSFTIKGDPGFSLVSPANGAGGLNRSVVLSWAAHPDADGYDFEVMDGTTVVAGYGINYVDGPYRATSVNLTLDYGKTYRWRARPRILPQDNPWSGYWTFTIKGDPGFSLISPADGAAGQPVSLRLEWSGHADADGYDYEVYDGATKIAGMGVTYSGGPYRSTSATVGLSYGKTYTWRARPRILPQDNPWSASRSFTTEAPPPVVAGIPVLVSPAQHATNVARPVTFDWQAAPNAVRYRLEVWYQPSDGGARQRVLNKSVTATSYKAGTPDPDPLGPGRNYYWKVLGINAAGQEGTWSSERHFSTRTTP